MITALSFELSHCDDQRVYEKYITILEMIDSNLAKRVAANVNATRVEPQDLPGGESVVSQGLTLSEQHVAADKPIIATRKIAVLIANGFDQTEVNALFQELNNEKAIIVFIGPVRNMIFAKGEPVGDGKGIPADHHFEGQRSTLFDAIYIPAGPDHVKILSSNGRVIHWIREAFGHYKPIAAIGDGE